MTLLSKVRAWLNESNAPNELWGEALLAATKIYNMTPHSALAGYISPYEAKTGNQPDISNIFAWGSIAYSAIATQKGKLDNRGKKGIIVGFESNNLRMHYGDDRIETHPIGNTFI